METSVTAGKIRKDSNMNHFTNSADLGSAFDPMGGFPAMPCPSGFPGLFYDGHCEPSVPKGEYYKIYDALNRKMMKQVDALFSHIDTRIHLMYAEFGPYSFLQEAIDVMQKKEGGLLENYFRLALAEFDHLDVLQPGIRLPIYKAAEKTYNANAKRRAGVDGILADPDDREKARYKPDAIVFNRANNTGYLFEVKRQTAHISDLSDITRKLSVSAMSARSYLIEEGYDAGVETFKVGLVDCASRDGRRGIIHHPMAIDQLFHTGGVVQRLLWDVNKFARYRRLTRLQEIFVERVLPYLSDGELEHATVIAAQRRNHRGGKPGVNANTHYMSGSHSPDRMSDAYDVPMEPRGMPRHLRSFGNAVDDFDDDDHPDEHI
jgi:hypothetical protein